MELVPASAGILRMVDDNWPPHRPAGAVHYDWTWAPKASHTTERWAVRCDGEVVSVWIGARKLLSLLGGKYYKVDNLEVRGDRTGAGIGAVTMIFLAARALDVGAVGLVLGATESASHVRFYTRAGGTDAAPRGWNPPAGLLPFSWDLAALQDLAGRLDDLEEEDLEDGR